MSLLGTETKTAADREATDKDDDSFFLDFASLGTETKTFVKDEETDSDKSDDELSLLQKII